MDRVMLCNLPDIKRIGEILKAVERNVHAYHDV